MGKACTAVGAPAQAHSNNNNNKHPENKTGNYLRVCLYQRYSGLSIWFFFMAILFSAFSVIMLQMKKLRHDRLRKLAHSLGYLVSYY